MNYRGRHVTLDAWLSSMPSNAELMEACERAIDASGMSVVCSVRKDFKPHGLTAVWVLEESHLTIHTYPEHAYLSVDCYTCGDEGNPKAAIDELLRLLPVSRSSVQALVRGQAA